MTPKGFDWVYRRFRENPVRGYRLIEAKPFENEHILAQTPDYYDRLKASYGENFFQQEVLGKYLNLQAGQVYYAFERRKNVGSFKVDANEPLLWSWDFNVHPMCSLVCQQRGEAVYVLDEIVLPTSSTPEVCEEFERRYGGHRARVRVYGDASGERTHTVTGSSDYHLIRQFFGGERVCGGIGGRPRKPARAGSVNTVNGRLRNARGERQLFINKKCRELIKDLEQVCYKPDSGQIDKDRDARRTICRMRWATCCGRNFVR